MQDFAKNGKTLDRDDYIEMILEADLENEEDGVKDTLFSL